MVTPVAVGALGQSVLEWSGGGACLAGDLHCASIKTISAEPTTDHKTLTMDLGATRTDHHHLQSMWVVTVY